MEQLDALSEELLLRQWGFDPPDGYAHVVMRNDLMDAWGGRRIQALCGKVWSPSRLDPEDMPLCEACVAERERILAGMKGLN